MKRILLFILAAGVLAISGAIRPAGPVPSPVDSRVRFIPVHVLIDPHGKPLACYQVTVLASNNATLVGVEGGESAAFEKAPYYDPKALQGQRIIIRAYDLGRELPSQKTRVATLMFRVSGAVQPEFSATLNVAGAGDGAAINAAVSLTPIISGAKRPNQIAEHDGRVAMNATTAANRILHLPPNAYVIRYCLYFLALLCLAALAGCAMTMQKTHETRQQQYVAGPVGITLGDLVPAQSLPARGEELWIIEKPKAENPANDTNPSADLVLPGGGTLLSVHGSTLLPMPLEKTDVTATLNGIIASVDVRQRFTNTTKETADAVYTFPLPQNAAVTEFILSIGRRHIRAILREKPQAEQLFREARSQGYLASLLVQQSPNVFSQRVANLEPGKGVDVEIRYFHVAEFRDGWFEFEFPMTVGLRGPGIARKPGRNGKDISLAVRLNAGMAIEGVECPTHKTIVKMNGNGTADVSLAPADEIPNRDFRLRYRLAGDGIKASLMTEKDGAGGTFALLLAPPTRIDGIHKKPLKVTLALMENAGRGGEKAAASLLRCLSADDAFRLVRCRDGGVDMMSHSVPATAENISRYADALEKSDYAALLDKFAPASSLATGVSDHAEKETDPLFSRVAFLINDGSTAPLSRLLAVPQNQWGNVQSLAVCVGAAADADLEDAVARKGGIAAVYFPTTGDASAMAKDLIARLSHPAISNLRLQWDNGATPEIFPGRTRDLFPGHPVLLTGRFEGQPPAVCRIFSGDKQVLAVQASAGSAVPGRSPIASIWARRKIADLGLSALSEPQKTLGVEIKNLALQYGLLSRFTAFVVVDADPDADAGITH